MRARALESSSAGSKSTSARSHHTRRWARASTACGPRRAPCCRAVRRPSTSGSDVRRMFTQAQRRFTIMPRGQRVSSLVGAINFGSKRNDLHGRRREGDLESEGCASEHTGHDDGARAHASRWVWTDVSASGLQAPTLRTTCRARRPGARPSRLAWCYRYRPRCRRCFGLRAKSVACTLPPQLHIGCSPLENFRRSRITSRL